MGQKYELLRGLRGYNPKQKKGKEKEKKEQVKKGKKKVEKGRKKVVFGSHRKICKTFFRGKNIIFFPKGKRISNIFHK